MYQDHDLGSPQLIHLLTTEKEKLKYITHQKHNGIYLKNSPLACAQWNCIYCIYVPPNTHFFFFFQIYALIKYWKQTQKKTKITYV